MLNNDSGRGGKNSQFSALITVMRISVSNIPLLAEFTLYILVTPPTRKIYLK